MKIEGAMSLAPGVAYRPGYLSEREQEELLGDLRAALAEAPLFQPTMPGNGKPFSVRMTNCGPLGWLSDAKGYRYQATHPDTGRGWPVIPRLALRAWGELSGLSATAEACLVNYYDAGAKMGLHQDRDEDDVDAPVVSLSLGDTGIFKFGGTTRNGPTKTVKLSSGDALVFGGPARHAFHGIERILGGSSRLLAEGGRFNLTLRRVTRMAGMESEKGGR